MSAVPKRIVFNFTHKCNMECPVCFLPFDFEPLNDTVISSVIDKLINIHPHMITISGAEPLQYHKLGLIAKKINENGIFVHLDTNAQYLQYHDLGLILQNVKLIGLPLDGSTAEIHGRVRGNPTHYYIIRKWLDKLSGCLPKKKINTVVCAKNIGDIRSIGEILTGLDIDRWSLYQFWPMQRGRENTREFEIDTNYFVDTCESVKTQFPNIRIEMSTIDARKTSYFFVTHTGIVYVIDPACSSVYLTLGSIYEADILEKWESVSDPRLNAQLCSRRICDEQEGKNGN